MTDVLIDARPHATAVKAAVNAALTGGNWRAYDLDDVPKPLPSIFVVVTVQRRPSTNPRQTAQAGTAGWRIGARAVGRTVDECRWAMNKVAAALNEKVLTVSSKPTTPIQFESEQTPTPDSGRQSGMSVYTFAH